MSRTRLAALAATLTCGLMLLGGAGVASAQTATPAAVPLAKTLKLTGATKSGKKFNGKFTIDHFIAKGGKTYALGTLTGKLAGKKVTKHNVKLPVSQNTSSAAAAQASCQVLDLVINPITLNLLGLVVHTDTIHLNITAVPGAGNLLGNLLCGILGILNPPTGGTGGLTGAQLAQLLNAILGALTPVLGG
jgi:hypothetical protein